MHCSEYLLEALKQMEHNAFLNGNALKKVRSITDPFTHTIKIIEEAWLKYRLNGLNIVCGLVRILALCR